MRILHVIGSLAPRDGGPAEVLPHMCHALTERGHEVEILTTNIDGPGELPVPLGRALPLDGGSITYFPAGRPRAWATSWPLGRALRGRIADFDVVHVHSLYLFHTFVASRTARKRGVPYVLRPHGTLNPYHRGIRRGRKAVYEALVERKNLQRAAAIHYTSASERRFAEEWGVRTRGFVIPHGVTPHDAEAPPPANGRRRVISLGRLTEKKGLDVLVRAFAQVASDREDVDLVLAGPDDEGLRVSLEELAHSLGLSGRVLFPGLVVGGEKAALLAHSDVFVLPSLDENFGVAAVEAMGAGVPVVLSKGVAVHEEVAAAGAGLVVARTPEDVARAIAVLLDDAGLAARACEAALRLVRERYSWERAAEALEEMYEYARSR